MPRLFFALWPDDATRAALHDMTRHLSIERASRVPAANLHVTLVFLGAVDTALVPALLALGDGVRGAPFSLVFASHGWWPGARVAWFAPATAPVALEVLVADLRHGVAAAGLATDRRPYRPHLTIARKLTRAPLPRRFAPLVWRVRSFALVRSVTAPAGAVYEVVREWPLRAAGAD